MKGKMNTFHLSQNIVQLLTTGQAFFETLLYESNCLWFWEAHIARLNRQLKAFSAQVNPALLKERVNRELKKNNAQKARVKIITALPFKENSVLNDDHIIILIDELKESVSHKIELHSANWPFSKSNQLTKMKSINFGFAYHTIFKNNGKHTLYIDAQQRLIETAFANIFLFRNGRLKTPPTSTSLLPGIIREQFIEYCNVTQEAIFLNQLKKEDLLFITNSIMEIAFVKSIDHLVFEENKAAEKKALKKWNFIKNEYKSSYDC
jgi:4-amino-4-deoxychorismate lyase